MTIDPTIHASSGRPATVSRGDVLRWLDEARAAARRTTFGDAVQIDQIDSLDVLLEPLHIVLLAALRAGVTSDDPQTVSDRARWMAYRLKRMYQRQRARLSSGPPRPAATLFWPREMTHVDAQLPVLAVLEKQGESCGLLTCQPSTFAQLRARGIAATFTGGAWPRAIARARAEGRLQGERAAAAPAMGLPRFETAQGPLDVEPLLRRTVCRMLPDVAEAIASAEMAVDTIHPEVIVVGNDVTMHGRAVCLVARRRGVPTAVLMHGNVTGDELHGRHLADSTIVYGEASRREMVRHGGDPARIVACGAPYLDRRTRQTGQIDPRLQERLKLAPSDRWLLVATSGAGDRVSERHQRQIIDNLFRLAAALPEVPLVVKLHRKDRAVHYQQALAASSGARVHVLEHGTPGFPNRIFDWLQGCSGVLTGASTVAVEAMLMDVPVVTMDFCEEIRGVDFIDAGATLHARDFAALQAAVERVLGPPATLGDLRQNMSNYLADAFFGLDGQSAERAARAIRGLAQGSRASR